MDVNLHGRYLWVSGGHLELNKTIYNLLIWKFNEWGKPSLKSESELPENTVKINAATGTQVKLERTGTKSARRMLGVRQAVTMQMKTEFDIQLGKTCKFGCATVACPLQKHECYLSYRTIYIPSVTYGFPATFFTDKQHDKLISTLNPRLLPRLGYNRSTPKTIVFAMQKYSGVGLLHPKCEQVAAKIQYVVQHIRADTS
eukprot:5694814-Ditylum_brightwellii.AAC.1